MLLRPFHLLDVDGHPWRGIVVAPRLVAYGVEIVWLGLGVLNPFVDGSYVVTGMVYDD